jgi:hypothetical protein
MLVMVRKRGSWNRKYYLTFSANESWILERFRQRRCHCNGEVKGRRWKCKKGWIYEGAKIKKFA